jgi:ComF family protein
VIAWRALTDVLLTTLFAPPCAVCERVLEQPLEGAVCDRCWRSIVVTAPPFLRTGAVSSAAAVGEYDGTLRDIIQALKYQRRRSAAVRLAELMSVAGAHVLAGADAVVPVPLHPRRERERGFNQADDLAHGLGLPVRRVLRRLRATLPQVDLAAAERQRNVRNAFAVVQRSTARRRVESAILVLVDDVITTGATLETCARVLLDAGAAEVRALTAARVASAPP